MRRRKACAGSTTLAATLALLLAALTFITVYLFVTKKWWFPPAITSFGHKVGAKFFRTLIFTGIVFVASQLGVAYAVFGFRKPGRKARKVEGNQTLMLLWHGATVSLLDGLP